MTPVEHAKACFSLARDLEELFGLHVDLVETSAIRNPIFLQSVEENRSVIYAAA